MVRQMKLIVEVKQSFFFPSAAVEQSRGSLGEKELRRFTTSCTFAASELRNYFPPAVKPADSLRLSFSFSRQRRKREKKHQRRGSTRRDSRRNSARRKTGGETMIREIRATKVSDESVKQVGQVHSLVSARPVRNARLNSPIAGEPGN